MGANPYAAGRKTVVIHADDLGMAHGGNVAFQELVRRGLCSCGSVMVPCPWFPEVAQMAAFDPSLDIGVHLTVNSEKRPYRWRPLTRPSPAAGLADADGYFWADVPSVRRHAHPDAVEAELRAQIDAALAAGIDVTHLDDHMGVVMLPEFVDLYARLGRDYDVPILLPADLARFHPMSYAGPAATDLYDRVVADAKARDEPVFDRVMETTWDRGPDAIAAYRAMFADIPDGLTYLALHFNTPGDFEAIEPEFAHIRTEEYALFRSGLIERLIADHDLTVVGMRDIRQTRREVRAARYPSAP
jgi:chitin disaccharide deacetylase